MGKVSNSRITRTTFTPTGGGATVTTTTISPLRRGTSTGKQATAAERRKYATSGGRIVMLNGRPLTKERLENERKKIVNARAAQIVKNFGTQTLLRTARKVGIPITRKGDQITLRTSPTTAIQAKIQGGRITTVTERSRYAKLGTAKIDVRRIQKLNEKLQREQVKQPTRLTTKQEFQKRLLSKQGYRVTKQNGNIYAIKGDRQLIITKDGRSVEAPKEAKIIVSQIPSKINMLSARERFKLSKREKDFLGGFIEYPKDVFIGLKNILSTGKYNLSSLNTLKKGLVSIYSIKSELNKIKKKPTKLRIKRVTKQIKKYNEDISPKVIRALKNEKKAKELLEKEESKLAVFTVGLVTAGYALPLIGGTTAIVGSVGLSAIGTVAVTAQTLQTIKKPTPRNFGKLVFYVLPTGIAILKSIRKLSPNFRPTVKNVGFMRKILSMRKNRNFEIIKEVQKGRVVYRGNKRLSKKAALKILRQQNRLIDQAMKELNWIKRNPEIIKARDFNPKIHNKYFKKLQGSYRQSIHVSIEPKAGKLFGKKTSLKLKKQREIERIALPKAVKPKKVRDLKVFGRQNRIIINFLIKNKVILGGGKAQNLQVSILNRRISRDFDGKVPNGAKNLLLKLANRLNREFREQKRFIVRKLKNVDAYSMRDRTLKKDIVDIANIGKERVPFVTTKRGLRVQNVKSLIKGKANALSKLQRYRRKGVKDLKDLIRLTGGKVRATDIVPRSKNPSHVFEVVRQPKGMGKSRLAFDETHMYFDYEAPIAYSKGKLYSIIKFPVSRISKFPKILRLKINKAARGELTAKEGIALRKSLNRYIKLNPNKFYLGPRTASLPIGEREFVLAEGSKFIKGKIYKSFDNDLQKFISIIEVGFRKPAKISLYKRFVKGWKRRPFTTLRLRLSNPDLLTVRRYTRLIEKDVTLSPKQNKNIIGILRRMFKSKKARLGRDFKKSKKRKGRIRREIERRRKKELIRKIKRSKIIKRKIQRKAIQTKRAKRKILLRKRSQKRKIIDRKTKPRLRITKKTESRQLIRKKGIRKTAPITTRQITARPLPTRKKLTRKSIGRIIRNSTTKKEILIPNITWKTKIPRKYYVAVNPIVRRKGVNKEINLRTTLNRAIKYAKGKTGRTLARSFQIKIVGLTKQKDIAKQSLQQYRLRKGRDPRVLTFVEKSKYALDTKQEKRQIRLARKLRMRKKKR